eukprot:TRINITY_DN64726_c0_g1_i1.p1 TRINITY_DN64726_c0_g1~~TRINITY_DN64726_c0_g1_i1.p1  ORF type:complete len:101 (-),score=7.66 TRINITY_DN64726_c0_g1_i1:303-605(-)
MLTSLVGMGWAIRDEHQEKLHEQDHLTLVDGGTSAAKSMLDRSGACSAAKIDNDTQASDDAGETSEDSSLIPSELVLPLAIGVPAILCCGCVAVAMRIEQ